MILAFTKMHGLGNDFVILDGSNSAISLSPQQCLKLADRRLGIGCDQILILRNPKSDQHLAAFEIWNSDGSRAVQCGNGVRCLGLYLHDRSETPVGQFLLGGPAGIVKIECLDDGLVRVDMGRPVFEASRVPLLLEPVDGWYPLPHNQQHINLGAVSMGNPHALVIVDNLSTTDVRKLGTVISQHSAFPEGCNAGFAEIVDRKNIKLRVYERGAAETLACGSGACAAMSILRKANLLDQTANVTQRGGSLILSWTGGTEPVIMKGSAIHVFEGILDE